MKVRTITSAAVAATAFGTVAAIAPPSARGATHHPAQATHTLRFTGVTMKFADLGKNQIALAEKAVNSAGKVIGFDVVNGVFDPATNSANDRYVLSTKGGLLYATFRFTNEPTTHGRVVGGTGAYRNATGTFTATFANKQGTRAHVTIRYSN